MSHFTILVTEKKTVPEIKKEVFGVRQKSLSFIENDIILQYTKSFTDQTKYSAIFIESYRTSLLAEKLSAYEERYYGDNRQYLENTFLKLSKKYLIAFGFYFDEKTFESFQEKIVHELPKEYQKDTLYILKNK